MSDDEAFGDNPFRALKAEQFPDRKKSRTLQPKVVKRSRRERRSMGQEDNGAEVSSEERELFLRAMGRVSPDMRVDGGFSLQELGVMPLSLPKNSTKGVHKSSPENTPESSPSSPKSSVNSSKKPRRRSCTASSTSTERIDIPVQSKVVGREENFAGVETVDEDAAVFLQAMQTVQPLATRGRDVNPQPAQGQPPQQGEIGMQDVMEGKLEFALWSTDEYMEGHVVGLDEMTMSKLRSGSLSPEAHLDLHGLNAVQAFEALRNFFRGSWYKGLRTVLVIPGRGRNSPDGVGVLREKLQNWLTQEPFKRVVLAFCTAQPHDGGLGSVYVLLRKYRKKGRVYWERMPADADLYGNFPR